MVNKIVKTLKDIDGKLLEGGKKLKEKIKKYQEEAPIRRAKEIQRLKDDIELNELKLKKESLNAQLKELKEKSRPKENMSFGI